MIFSKEIILSIGAIIFLSGCVGTTIQPESNKSVSSKKISSRSTMDIINSKHDDEDDEEEVELYFDDTKGKIFYGGDTNGKNRLDNQVNILLSNIFAKAKKAKKLPKVSRRKKLNIAIEIDDNSDKRSKLLNIAQKFVLSNRRYAISNIDKESLSVLKKVRKKEKDGLYKNKKSVKTKNVSDIILYLSSSNNGDILTINIKLLSKNSTPLAVVSKDINLNKKILKEWMEVKVPRLESSSELYEVMRFPVTKKQYKGVGNDISVGSISYKAANKFCQKKMDGELITPYVFESARTSLVLGRPTGSIKSELIAQFDEDDDEPYIINEEDNIEGSDSSMITFMWNSEKYFAVSNMFRSSSTTFRCMRVK